MSTVHTIDCHYLGAPGVAAAYLMIEGERASFVENNTALAVPRLLEALEAAGRTPEQVEYVFVTHVHLDHAGGSSALMEACPNAVLMAHPRAVRHLVDPSKLVASAKQVYGEERFRALYGEIHPIPEHRVKAVEDGTRIVWGSRTLEFFHTRGHANHHLCIEDSKTRGIFTGDAFGLAYPALQEKGTFAFPSTSPTDFIPEAATAVVAQIAGRKPERVFPTHFGEHTDVNEIARQLASDIAFSAALMEEARGTSLEGEALDRFCRERLQRRFEERLSSRGIEATAEVWQLLELDLDLNAQGIAWAAMKARKPARPS